MMSRDFLSQMVLYNELLNYHLQGMTGLTVMVQSRNYHPTINTIFDFINSRISSFHRFTGKHPDKDLFLK